MAAKLPANILTPGGIATDIARAVVLVDQQGNALATAAAPIPTQPAPSGTTPLVGQFTAAGASPLFIAIPGHAIWVRLFGTFVATVQVQRCDDGTTASAQLLTVAGATYAVFTAPCQEAVSSEDDSGVGYRLNCSAYTSGTVNYQLGHK